jgi:phenylpropionate dioxygenase-like ring-hydroxylating dioxygenase large terminal subunit
VATGTLECLYHGWQFADGESGRVTHIPALLPEKEIPAAARCR